MDAKSLAPRLLARPRLWWVATAVIALCALASIIVRQLSARVQADLLRSGGWEIHDLRLVDSRIEPFDVVRGMALAADGTLWVATDYIPLSYDGQRWQAYDHAGYWPFGDMRALIFYEEVATAQGADGRVWTGGTVCSEGTYLDRWCSCMVTPSPEYGQASLRFDIPDSSCGNVTGMAFDQTGRLWVGFWTDIRNASRFGLASYAENQWSFYETGDIRDPLMEPSSSLKALLADSSGGLWLGLMGGPYVARIRPTSSTFSPDPVPDRVVVARRVSNALARTMGILFCPVFLVAAWSTYLNSKPGLAAAQRLRAERPAPATRSRSAVKRTTARVLVGGIILATWTVICFLLNRESLDFQFGAGDWLNLLLVWSSIAFVAGAGAASLVSLGSRAVRTSPSPSILVLGYVAVVLGVLIFVVFVGLIPLALALLVTG